LSGQLAASDTQSIGLVNDFDSTPELFKKNARIRNLV